MLRSVGLSEILIPSLQLNFVQLYRYPLLSGTSCCRSVVDVDFFSELTWSQ